MESVNDEHQVEQQVNPIPLDFNTEDIKIEDDGSLEGYSTSESVSDKNENNPFDCNICLDPVKHPVVTRCGHLYCWSCLYRWLEPGMLPEEKQMIIREQIGFNRVLSGSVDSTRRCCPVCKAETSISDIIPIYVRNDQSNTTKKRRKLSRKENSSTSLDQHEQQNDIPSRPLPPPPRSSPSAHAPQHIFPHPDIPQQTVVDASVQQSLISALLGLQSGPVPSRGTALSPEDATSEFLSRLLLVLGSFVVLCLLLF